jgi:glycerophosphoryl diester phosphodiesterase
MSNETFKFIETYRIRNLSNYIGIHIRRGDKLKHEAREISIDRYIKGIERILQKNKAIQQIFVASDDHTVVKELRQLKPTWNFVSIYDNNHQRTNPTGHFQAQFNRLSRQQKLNETRLFMCELQMLVNSEYVLCGMTSNICRLVLILRHQHPSTVISLDRSWIGT